MIHSRATRQTTHTEQKFSKKNRGAGQNPTIQSNSQHRGTMKEKGRFFRDSNCESEEKTQQRKNRIRTKGIEERNQERRKSKAKTVATNTTGGGRSYKNRKIAKSFKGAIWQQTVIA